MTLKPSVAASDLKPEWYVAVRDAMSRYQGAMRANPHRPCIDVWSGERKAWLALQLPGDGVDFVDYDARNAVLRRLEAE